MTAESRRDAVTGAFGFTGRAIAEALLGEGREVVTLSRRSGRGDRLAERLAAIQPLDFSKPAGLVEALSGVDTLFNTYWMRFPRGGRTFDDIVTETQVLLDAAARAGVRRLVHVSVIQADEAGETPYVRAKGRTEALVRSSGLSFTIVRPTLTYGSDDILINNLAWALRRLPVYGIPGRGHYRIQPVHVDDVARICIEAAAEAPGGIVDAAGPETFEYRELVARIRSAIGSRSLVLPMPTFVVLAAARVLGSLVGDVVLTRDELRELMSSLLTSAEPPRGRIRLSDWLPDHAAGLGRRWSSELARNYRGVSRP